MKLVGNALNGTYFDSLVGMADSEALESIVLAVAYVTDLGPISDLATRRRVPLTLHGAGGSLAPVGEPIWSRRSIR